jgi:hypothetical protein
MSELLHRRAPWWIALALAAGCSEASPPADAVAADAAADASEVEYSCPSLSYDPLFSQPCPGLEGVECRYGYMVPGCGGRTQTCRLGRWNEVHTDPSASCFDAGPDAADATGGD